MKKYRKPFAAITLFLALVTLLCGSVTAEASVKEFQDVTNETSYYYNPVYWAVENGITSGVSSTSFSPNGPCTRAQIVTFLWKAAGSPYTSSANTFSDVKANQWYTRAVNWAVSNGITSGLSARKFGPSVVCTRAQAVTLLWKAAGAPYTASVSTFTDVKPGSWYAKAVNWAVAKGITSGVSARRFAPQQQCSRAQIVTFLWKNNGSVNPQKPEKIKIQKLADGLYHAGTVPDYRGDTIYRVQGVDGGISMSGKIVHWVTSDIWSNPVLSGTTIFPTNGNTKYVIFGDEAPDTYISRSKFLSITNDILNSGQGWFDLDITVKNGVVTEIVFIG